MIMSPQLPDVFAGEHRHTEQILEVLKELARQHKWQEICEQTRHLSRDLENHINVEERYVYPAVERCVKDEDLLRTLAILRKRHMEIPNDVLEIQENAEDADESETLSSIELLERILLDHHRTEETHIFPFFDREGALLDSAEAAVFALKNGHNQ